MIWSDIGKEKADVHDYNSQKKTVHKPISIYDPPDSENLRNFESGGGKEQF